jgi:hypothetical protein
VPATTDTLLDGANSNSLAGTKQTDNGNSACNAMNPENLVQIVKLEFNIFRELWTCNGQRNRSTHLPASVIRFAISYTQIFAARDEKLDQPLNNADQTPTSIPKVA